MKGLPNHTAHSEIINYAHRAQTSMRTRIFVADECFGSHFDPAIQKEEAWHTSWGNYTRYFFHRCGSCQEKDRERNWQFSTRISMLELEFFADPTTKRFVNFRKIRYLEVEPREYNTNNKTKVHFDLISHRMMLSQMNHTYPMTSALVETFRNSNY